MLADLHMIRYERWSGDFDYFYYFFENFIIRGFHKYHHKLTTRFLLFSFPSCTCRSFLSAETATIISFHPDLYVLDCD